MTPRLPRALADVKQSQSMLFFLSKARPMHALSMHAPCMPHACPMHAPHMHTPHLRTPPAYPTCVPHMLILPHLPQTISAVCLRRCGMPGGGVT